MKLFPALVVLASMCTSTSAFFAPSSSSLLSSTTIIKKSKTQQKQSTTLYMSDVPTSISENKNPFDFFSSLLQGNKTNSNQAKEEPKPKLPDVVIDPDFRIAAAFAAVGGLIFGITGGSVYGYIQGGITELFALLLAVQATRVRFIFDETAFELKIGSGDGDELKSSGENIVVGGENRWTYDSFVNYDFFPKRGLPILVYFKENQTPEDKWNEGPGGMDKVGGGQVHFFPAFCNVDQLKEQFALRGCAKIEE